MSSAWTLHSIALLSVALSGTLGCSPVVERDRDLDDGGHEVEEETDEGVGGAGQDAPETPDAEPEDERFALCARPPPRPEGLREGTVPAGSLDDEEARAIFQRAGHEVGHLADALMAQAEGEPNDLFLIEGDTISSDRDGEALRGTLTRDLDSGLVCAALAFGSWTGGHGGWGLSALDGSLLLLVDGDEVESRGTLGLVESGPLRGAPLAPVRIDLTDGVVSGDVGGFPF